MNMANSAPAFALLMKEMPNQDHYDRPLWRYQSCVFTECPYCVYPLSTIKTEKSSIAAGKEINHG